MQAFKVTTDTGLTYYMRAEYHHRHIIERPGVVEVEAVAETEYVASACIFWAGVMHGETMAADRRERIIAAVSAVGLWHAFAAEFRQPCVCARCRPEIRSLA